MDEEMLNGNCTNEMLSNIPGNVAADNATMLASDDYTLAPDNATMLAADHVPVLLQKGDLAAAGLCNWTPPGALEWLLEATQVTTGLPFFLAIAYVTFA